MLKKTIDVNNLFTEMFNLDCLKIFWTIQIKNNLLDGRPRLSLVIPILNIDMIFL